MPNEIEPRELKAARKRTNDLKWQELEKRGYTKPKDEAERMQRLKDAHGGV